MKEKEFERLLNIQTSEEQMGYPKSFHYNRYEPTPYSALDQLFKQYKLAETDCVVDFGCGKGRLIFYLHHLFNINVTGVEMDESLYNDALKNLERYLVKNPKAKGKIHFQYGMAQNYEIQPNENRFYFFNPFSIQIFIKVVNHILQSVESQYRSIELILYYPSEDYMHFLDHQSPFILKEEIQLDGEYDHNHFEKLLIYSLSY